MKIILIIVFLAGYMNCTDSSSIGLDELNNNLSVKYTQLGLKATISDGHIKLSKGAVSAITYSTGMDGRISARPATDEIADKDGIIIDLWIEPSKNIQEQWGGRFKSISLAGLTDDMAIIKRPYDSMYGCQDLINNGNDILLVNIIYNNANSLLVADLILDDIKVLVK